MIELLDFWAPWCGQCKAFAPTVEAVVEKLGVKITKVDVEKDLTLASQYSIMNLPTVVILQDGKEVCRVTGLVSEQILLDKVKEFM